MSVAGWTCRARATSRAVAAPAQSRSQRVAELLELAARAVPLYPRPVIQTLQRQVDALVSLEVDHRQPSLAGEGEHVDYREATFAHIR
jgi:hypothetical protein